MLIFRYLAKEVLTVMTAVSIALLLITMSSRFVKYLAQAASGDLATDVLFSIMLFRIPGFLELIVPLALFIGILLAYGRLYVESEMVVLSACGISNRRLLGYTMLVAGFVALIVGSLSIAGVRALIGQNLIATVADLKFLVAIGIRKLTIIVSFKDISSAHQGGIAQAIRR